MNKTDSSTLERFRGAVSRLGVGGARDFKDYEGYVALAANLVEPGSLEAALVNEETLAVRAGRVAAYLNRYGVTRDDMRVVVTPFIAEGELMPWRQAVQAGTQAMKAAILQRHVGLDIKTKKLPLGGSPNDIGEITPRAAYNRLSGALRRAETDFPAEYASRKLGLVALTVPGPSTDEFLATADIDPKTFHNGGIAVLRNVGYALEDYRWTLVSAPEQRTLT